MPDEKDVPPYLICDICGCAIVVPGVLVGDVSKLYAQIRGIAS